MTSNNWITDPATGHQHLNGIPWHRAPRPPRWHRCKPQTIGTVDDTTVYRCACGGLSRDRHTWIERNLT